MILLPYLGLCVSVTLATLGLRPAGWLDRLVQMQREKFVTDFKEVAPVKIRASIEYPPAGYVDSTKWDFASIVRLLKLIRQSVAPQPLRRALRRALQPTRRWMTKKDTYKHFPNLKVDVYYDASYEAESDDYEEENTTEYATSTPLDLDQVVVISNPVEARLPSAQISLRLIKDIMEARSRVARMMPTTKKRTITTKKRSKTNSPPKENTTQVDLSTQDGNASADTGSQTTGASNDSAVTDANVVTTAAG